MKKVLSATIVQNALVTLRKNRDSQPDQTHKEFFASATSTDYLCKHLTDEEYTQLAIKAHLEYLSITTNQFKILTKLCKCED